MPDSGQNAPSTPTPGVDRRAVLRAGVGALGAAVPGLVWAGSADAAPVVRKKPGGPPLRGRLMDPSTQPMFTEYAPNALAPGFVHAPGADREDPLGMHVRTTVQEIGLVDPDGQRLQTPVWGYAPTGGTPSWPGPTIQATSDHSTSYVQWSNDLFDEKHLLPVDTSTHWCFSMHGYTQYTIAKDGVPIITHLHGGHTAPKSDGNPEFFYTPGAAVVGPQWAEHGGFDNVFEYDNDVPAGSLWYHDHALGLTRLNVYAGLAGFYFVRDDEDTGTSDNPLGLPAYPYEMAYAIQDRMFTQDGKLFYPAYPGDPFYDDFINGEGAVLPKRQFPSGGPTALAEFFGDFIVVNGKIWPKEDVEPRHYRLRLLNGCDSRFLVLQFVVVDADATEIPEHPETLPFDVIGSDQGLGAPHRTDTLVFEPGGRYDIVVDFGAEGLEGKRVIMTNLGGDAPFGGGFGGELEPEDQFPNRQTDRIMAFDVVVPVSEVADDFGPEALSGYDGIDGDTTTRKVALFEGKDEFGRLQPLLGTVQEDEEGDWGLFGTGYTWSNPTTETPTVDTTEIWEIYNFTGDAHPVHLHQVNFEILDRQKFIFEEAEHPQIITMHDGSTGVAPQPINICLIPPKDGGIVHVGPEYYETAPKDMVTALPGPDEGLGELVRIRMHFDIEGRYVWHCHILSHEDHEMMRVLEVQPSEE